MNGLRKIVCMDKQVAEKEIENSFDYSTLLYEPWYQDLIFLQEKKPPMLYDVKRYLAVFNRGMLQLQTLWKNINCDQIFTLLRLLVFVRKIRRYEDGRFFYTLHQFTPFICCNIVLISLTYFIYNWELEEWEGLVEEKEVCSFTTKTGKKRQKGNV